MDSFEVFYHKYDSNSISPGNLLTAGNFDRISSIMLNFFNAYVCKCKQIYSLLISTKAKFPNSFKKLITDFKLSDLQKDFFFHIKLLVKRMSGHSNIEC